MQGKWLLGSRVEDIAKMETLTPIQKEIVTALKDGVNAG